MKAAKILKLPNNNSLNPPSEKVNTSYSALNQLILELINQIDKNISPEDKKLNLG